MNIAVTPPGINFEFACLVLGPDMPAWQLRAFARAYDRAGDWRWSPRTFRRNVRDGHVICCVVVRQDLSVAAQFGIELMIDRDGWPFTQFLFFESAPDERRLRALQKLVPLVVETAWRISMAYKEAETAFPYKMRLLLIGRKGWRRVVKKLGLQMDEEGWITEDQEAFRHGIFGRSVERSQ
jgi:hypothetical protein